jgi:hypothetical protein
MYAKWENSWWGAKVGWLQTFDLVLYVVRNNSVGAKAPTAKIEERNNTLYTIT